MTSTRCPSPEELEVTTLGRATVPSPLAARGTLFVADDCRVVIPGTTDQLPNDGDPMPSFEAAGPRERLFFEAAGVRAAIVTCGGLCPGINDVVRALVLTLWHGYGVRSIVGFRRGYAGLVPGNGHAPLELDPPAVHDIHGLGGTILGTSRGPQDVGTMVDTLIADRIDMLFTIGGDGTLRGATALNAEIARRGAAIAVIGIPKTIDNDIDWVERSFGFATAVNEATRSIVAAHTEAHAAFNGIGLVKLMGRYSGSIAAHATLANSQVNFCLIPEVPFDLDSDGGLLALLEARVRQRQHAVVVVAEGAGQEHLERPPGGDASGNRALGDIGTYLKARIAEHFRGRELPFSVKYIDPSYLIRSLPANAFDSALCLTLGQHAVHAAMSGRTGMLVGTWRGRATHVPLPLASERRRQLDPRGATWQRVLEVTGQPRQMR